MDKLETEAKFVIPDLATFTALQQLTHLGDFELKPIGVKTVVDRYLDTANKRLYQAGWACRLRSVEGKQLISLKSLTPAQDNVHRRQELETKIETTQVPVDQPQAWPDSPAKELVMQSVGPALLQTLFTLHQTRHQFHGLKQGQPIIELSLDEVSLNDSTAATYRELELELIEQGVEADLILLVEALQAQWPLKVETQSKFERALAEVTAHKKPGRREDEQMNNGKLTDQEKSTLEKIANGPNELLSKRATIILMTDSGSSVANIAKEVSLAPKTVQRWQKEFSQKRLGIFPDDALNDTQPFANPVMTPMTEIGPEPGVQTAPKPLKKKKQAKKEANIPSDGLRNGALIEYPVRDQIGLEPTDTLAEAGRKVLSFHFGRMLTHEPGTRLGSDVEGVHDMRVATRRMRAAFQVFDSGFSKKAIKPLRVGLRTTGRVLGEVRDLDVLLEKLQQYRQSLPESEQPGLQPLLETWLAEREEAREEMLAYLDSKKYLRFKQDLLKFVTTADRGAKPTPNDAPVPYQLRYLVPCLIYERFRDMHAYDGLLENATMDTLHQLRITFKQLRYTLEYFAEILGEEGKLVIEEVKALQDHLGELNDARVASDLLRDLLADWDKKQRHLPRVERQNSTQLAAYLQAKLEVQQHLLETFPQAWARFNHPELRRNLALAIAVL